MLADPKEGLAKFGLRLHEDKTRLIEFGRFAASTRHKRGERRPETFAFLGFTPYCGRTRDGRFIVKHKTQSNRLTRKMTALRQEAWRPMHRPLAEQHRWYASVRPLRLLRHAAQLAGSQRVPAGSATYLVQLPQAAEPEESSHGLRLVRDRDVMLAHAMRPRPSQVASP